MYLTLILIICLAYHFIYWFYYDQDHYPYVLAQLVWITFLVSSHMCMIFLVKTWLKNPGFLPRYFETPLTSENLSPMRLIRIYNMRTWAANNIFDFKNYVD